MTDLEMRLLKFVRYVAHCQNCKMGLREWRLMAQELLREID